MWSQPSHPHQTFMVTDTHRPLSPSKQPETKKGTPPAKQPAKRKAVKATAATATTRSRRRRPAVLPASQVDLCAETLPTADALPPEVQASPSDPEASSKEDAAVLTASALAQSETLSSEDAVPIDTPAQVSADSGADGTPIPTRKFYLERQEAGFGPYTMFQLCGGLRLGIFKTSDQVLDPSKEGWLEVSQLLPPNDEFLAEPDHTALTLPSISQSLLDNDASPAEPVRTVLVLPSRPLYLARHAPTPPPRPFVQARQEPAENRDLLPTSNAFHTAESKSDVSSSHEVSFEHKWTRAQQVLAVVLTLLVIAGAVMFGLAHRPV